MSFLLYDLVGKDSQKPFSPHCWKIKMALAHKGIVFETVPTRFVEVKAIEGGAKTVPVINHNGVVKEDSFEIGVYLKDRYPDLGRQLYSGDGSIGLTRFVESWTNTQLHGWIAGYAIVDIFNMLDEESKPYFRESREKRFGKSLEDFVAGRDSRVEDLLKNRLAPLRTMLGKQDFIGGKDPLFADYIVFGAFQWLRVTSGLAMIPDDDPVKGWINRCLELHDGIAGKVAEANI